MSQGIDLLMDLYAMYVRRVFEERVLREFVCKTLEGGLSSKTIKKACKFRRSNIFKRYLVHELVKNEDDRIAETIIKSTPPNLINAYIIPGFITSEVDIKKLKEVLDKLINIFHKEIKHSRIFKRYEGNESSWMHIFTLRDIPRIKRGAKSVPMEGLGIHKKGFFLIKLKRMKLHILPIALSINKFNGNNIVLRLSTMAIRDWIPLCGMAFTRKGQNKDRYFPIEYDVVIPVDFLLWNDGITEVRVYAGLSSKTRQYLLRFWQAIIRYSLCKDIYIHSLMELRNQEHCISHMLSKFIGQNIITSMCIRIKNSNLYVVAYGEKKLKLSPSISRSEVDYRRIMNLLKCSDLWQLTSDIGMLSYIRVRVLANDGSKDFYQKLLNDLEKTDDEIQRRKIIAALSSLTRAYITIYLATGTIKVHKLPKPPYAYNSSLDSIRELEVEVHKIIRDEFNYAKSTGVIDSYEDLYRKFESLLLSKQEANSYVM